MTNLKTVILPLQALLVRTLGKSQYLKIQPLLARGLALVLTSLKLQNRHFVRLNQQKNYWQHIPLMLLFGVAATQVTCQLTRHTAQNSSQVVTSQTLHMPLQNLTCIGFQTWHHTCHTRMICHGMTNQHSLIVILIEANQTTLLVVTISPTILQVDPSSRIFVLGNVNL